MASFPKKQQEDKKTKKQAAAESSDPTVVENLYKKNIELLVRNKTLALLSELYEISILTLEPRELAARIAKIVQTDLSFEIAAIFKFNVENDTLEPLAFSESQRIIETLKGLELAIDTINIPNVASKDLLKNLVYDKKSGQVDSIKGVWNGLIEEKKLEAMVSESNIKTVLLYPLTVENKTLGMLVLAINRSYETLSEFERESIKSFVNVIAVALEKAYLYKELQDANERLKELDRQKDELLSIVSHQLATPTTAIRWQLEMMLDGDIGSLTDKQKEHLESTQKVTANLVDLIQMILDVSRIQLGKMKVAKQELDLNEFFKELINVINPKALEKKTNFKVSIPKKLPVAMLDKRLTNMTLENLLSNAVKYTPSEGLVEFTVTLEGDMLKCVVKDAGVGIPEKDKSQIFGKLYRASNVRNTVDGNGFGLYVAKGAVEGQGGSIRFESTEGKGTTFYVELPIKDKGEAAA